MFIQSTADGDRQKVHRRERALESIELVCRGTGELFKDRLGKKGEWSSCARNYGRRGGGGARFCRCALIKFLNSGIYTYVSGCAISNSEFFRRDTNNYISSAVS